MNDAIWGPVWSNDTLNILSTGATFHDEVGTAGIINGASYGTFVKGYQIHQKPIHLPTLTTLTTLSGLATAGGMNFTAPTTDSTVRMRIEFVAVDLDGNHDSTEANEGFFRIYTASAGNEAWLRANWTGTISALPNASATPGSSMTNCGDWHADATGTLKFFPWASHWHRSSHGVTLNTWFDTVTAGGLPGGATAANIVKTHAEGDSTLNATQFSAMLQHHANVRCYLGGDPHLVSQARDTSAGGSAVLIAHKGGEDTTFTATDRFGAWTLYSTTPPPLVAAARPGDKNYLFPLYRGFSTNTKGVIYVAGTVGVSGVLRGDITLYTPNWIIMLDDLRYANDPATGLCVDILGLIAGQNIQIADNSLNTPSYVKTGSPGYLLRSFDETPDLTVHGVVMALGTSFYVQNYATGPTDGGSCGGATVGRGCLYLTGGLIQNNRGPVGTSAGTGFSKRYSYDHCAVVNPPPYFPTTGRFSDNRYYELDPVRFNVTQLFRSLSPAP